MFNSAIIDTAIGIVFIYLLLSLICSAIGEAIESIMRNRAADLERGIRELVTDERTVDGLKGFTLKLFPRLGKLFAKRPAPPAQSPPGSPPQQIDYVAELYDHPLLNGLFRGTYQEVIKYRSQGFIRRLFQWIWRSSPKLPTYIPSRNFALALMDLAVPGDGQNPSGAQGALADPKTFVLGSPPGNPIEQLRSAIVGEGRIPPDSKLGKALLTLIDAAGNDVNKARDNIENWFDSAMDRASGWYKRRAQFLIFAIGLIVAIAVNADSVLIIRRLSTDKALRESVAAEAIEYAKANATASPSPSSSPAETRPPAGSQNQSQRPTPTPTPMPTPTPEQTPATSPTASASPNSPDQSAASSEPSAPAKEAGTPQTEAPSPSSTTTSVSNATANPTPKPTSTPTCWDEACKGDKANSMECKVKKNRCAAEACWQQDCKDPDSPKCKLAKSQCELNSLGLPMSWSGADGDILLTWPGWHWKMYGGWWWQFYWHGVGWLLTALAISLGAPFWFDMLNKFIVIRSTVKPKEKSPEEKSKN